MLGPAGVLARVTSKGVVAVVALTEAIATSDVGASYELWTGLGPRSFLPRGSRVACTRVSMVINLALQSSA